MLLVVLRTFGMVTKVVVMVVNAFARFFMTFSILVVVVTMALGRLDNANNHSILVSFLFARLFIAFHILVVVVVVVMVTVVMVTVVVFPVTLETHCCFVEATFLVGKST